MNLLIWGIAVLLWAFWSFFAWAAHALLTWPGWSTPDLTRWSERARELPLPEWASAPIAQWGPWAHERLLGFPDLSPWFGAAVWVLWGVGTASLAALAIASSILVRTIRRRLRG